MNGTLLWKYENDNVLADRICYRAPRTEDFLLHSHSLWEFLFVHSGSVKYRLGNDVFRLYPGDLVIISPGQPHRLIIENDVDYERTDLILPHGMLSEELPSFLPDNRRCFRFAEEEEQTAVFARMYLYRKRCSDAEFALLFPNLVREMLICVRSVAEKEKFNYPQIIRAALEYVDAHLTGITGLDELCDHLFITKSHLHHLFRSCMSVTPKQYILSRRLFLADRSIQSGVLPTVAASNCGFGDYSSFFRAYKKAFGHAPKRPSDRGKPLEHAT